MAELTRRRIDEASKGLVVAVENTLFDLGKTGRELASVIIDAIEEELLDLRDLLPPDADGYE